MLDTHLDREHTRGWVNAQSYAEGDGETDDGASLVDAALAAAGRELFIGDGTYVVSGRNGPIVVPDGTVVRFAGKNAKIDYRGAGAAFEVRDSKNVAIYDLNVDLTNAGAGAIALWIRGLWFGQIYKPRVRGGAATHTGILVETGYALNPLDPWGAYLIEIHNPDIESSAGGTYAIRARQTPGDTVKVTHLQVYGGWSTGFDYGLHYRDVNGFAIRGFVSDTGVDGYNIDTSSDGLVEPGELGPNAGYGINWGAGCQAMKLLVGNKAGVGGALGYQNNAAYTPELWDQGRHRLYASRGDQTYYAELASLFAYGESFNLLVNGGGFQKKLFKWGDAAGLLVDAGGGGTGFVQGIRPGTDAAAAQAGQIFMGAGIPNNANGNNGDIYHRTDTPGVANQRLYVKSAGAWVGIV